MSQLPLLAILQDAALEHRITTMLSGERVSLYMVESLERGIRLLEQNSIRLVLLEASQHVQFTLDTLEYFRQRFPAVRVILITRKAVPRNILRPLKKEAAYVLTGEFSTEDLRSALQQDTVSGHPGASDQSGPGGREFRPGNMVGDSPGMRKVYRMIAKAASVREKVMLTGESGTGKELVARAVHERSGVAAGPFIPVNCGAIPVALLESELFGYTKGAFTGAREDQEGFFQAASGGTIFLDEISATSPAMQAKFLRVLEGNELWRVGARSPEVLNVRIIAATNKDLPRLVEEGRFRRDLFYRLHILGIHLPPLRERTDDIPLLVNYFAGECAREQGRSAPIFAPEVLETFERAPWPGNVRELKNTVKRLITLAENGVITADDLPELSQRPTLKPQMDRRTLDEVQREHILKILEQTDGNKSHAARILGITPKTLRSKINSGTVNR